MGYINKDANTRWYFPERISLVIDTLNPISSEQLNVLADIANSMTEDVRIRFVFPNNSDTLDPNNPYIRIINNNNIFLNSAGSYGVFINGEFVGVPGKQDGILEHVLFLHPSATLDEIKHELYHILGLFHEHQRSDSNLYIELNLSNIKDSAKPSHEPIIHSNLITISPYNYDSIMHYPNMMPNHAIDTSQPVHIRLPNIPNPNNPSFQSIDSQDIYPIKLMYGLGKTLNLGDVSTSVLILKRMLDAFGYSIGPFDLMLDEITLDSVINFHVTEGIGITDKVTSTTWNRLGSKLPFILIGNHGQDILFLNTFGPQVRTLQCILFSLGFDLGVTGNPPNTGIDGDFGQRTGKAIVQLKKDLRLLPLNADVDNTTTIVDDNMRQKLSSLLKTDLPGIIWN